jgi:hypothetical protein
MRRAEPIRAGARSRRNRRRLYRFASCSLNPCRRRVYGARGLGDPTAQLAGPFGLTVSTRMGSLNCGPVRSWPRLSAAASLISLLRSVGTRPGSLRLGACRASSVCRLAGARLAGTANGPRAAPGKRRLHGSRRGPADALLLGDESGVLLFKSVLWPPSCLLVDLHPFSPSSRRLEVSTGY